MTKPLLTKEEKLIRSRAHKTRWRKKNLKRLNAQSLAIYHKRKSDPEYKEMLKSSWKRDYYKHREKRLAKDAAYKKKNKVRLAEERRKYLLQKQFGISIDDYNSMKAKQGDACAICGRKNRSKRALAVDHCHKSGGVRGLLCDKCNIGIGYMDDSRENLERAIKYLNAYEEQRRMFAPKFSFSEEPDETETETELVDYKV